MFRTVSPGCRFRRLAIDLPLPAATYIGNLIHFQPIHTARVGEAEQIGVRRVNDELRDEIFFARLHTEAACSAAPLLTVG